MTKAKKQKRTLKKKARIAQAKVWLPTFTGTKIIRAYRKKFLVDTSCAARELQEIGYVFPPGYVDQLLKSEASRLEQLRIKKEKKLLDEQYNDWQNDDFYFIAGYTSGGAPFGVTWEEMGLEPCENDQTPTTKNQLQEKSVILESERLLFRNITFEDFDDLAIMFRDPELMSAWEHTFSDEQISVWIDEQAARYKKDTVGYFAAIRKDTGRFVGQIGLLWNVLDKLRVLELGYMIKREYWNQGYATEGAMAFVHYAFARTGINKIYASIRPENQRSIRVAGRIGMREDSRYMKQYCGKDMEHILFVRERDTRDIDTLPF